jgi:spore coat polysaccharide biosynthesis protein SpsF (cytidylyltransferase family)
MTEGSAFRPGLILLARNGSARLPRKSMRLVHGEPVLLHQIRRLRRLPPEIPIVLATSTLPEDDSLEQTGRSAGLPVFRGDPLDVVRRMVAAADFHDFTYIVEVGGDDVFCEAEFVELVVAEHVRTDVDFAKVSCIPWGTTPFGVRVDALRRVIDLNSTGSTDGWERWFLETGLFKATVVENPDARLNHPEFRLGLDYPEDLTLFTAIYERLLPEGPVPSLHRVIELLRGEPEIAAINADAQQLWNANYSSTALPQLKPGNPTS